MITSTELYELADRLETHEYEVSELKDENRALERENCALAAENEYLRDFLKEIGIDPDGIHSLSDLYEIKSTLQSANLPHGLLL